MELIQRQQANANLKFIVDKLTLSETNSFTDKEVVNMILCLGFVLEHLNNMEKEIISLKYRLDKLKDILQD